MANISKAERERRAALAAESETPSKNPEPVRTTDWETPPPMEPVVHTAPPMKEDVMDAMKRRYEDGKPVERYDPVEVVIKASEPSVYEPAERDMREIIVKEMEAEKKLSLDAIEEVAKLAASKAADAVKNDPLANALRADPTNLRKRKDFLARFGGASTRPPRPAPGPFGHKDEACLRWDATYEPQKFVESWSHSKAPLIANLVKEARNRLANS